MKFLKYILKVTLVFLVSLFWWLNYVNAASVDVWPDIDLLLPVSDDLHLSATTSGFDTCDFIDYMWEETSNTLFIEMPYEKDMAVIYSNDLNDNPWTYTIKLTATCNWWNPDDWWFIEEDSFILNINWWSSNQAPTDINLSNSNVDENVATWSLVWNLNTTDSDSTSFTYSFADYSNYPDNQLFKINNNELRIDFSPDYELKNSYSIKIKTDDQQWWTFEKVFTITINDLDETVASVDAWDEQNVVIWDIVYLRGTLNWFPSSWCNFIYNWSDDTRQATINNSWTLNQAYFETNSFTWSIRLKIWFKVTVSSESITHDSCWKTWIYNDTVFININTASSWDVLNTTTHHRSHSSKMKEEADKIFRISKNIKLNLNELKNYSKYFYKLDWNYIGWDWQIVYELEYSNKKDFTNYSKLKTKSRFYVFKKDFFKDLELYFFRVKATYKNKESPYSNIVSIVNKDNPLNEFKIICKNCNNKISFWDVFETVDLLIEKSLNINCVSCERKKTKFIFSDILLDKNNLDLYIDKNNYCKKNIDYTDIFDYNKGLDFKVECSKNKINKKIDYNDLLK